MLQRLAPLQTTPEAHIGPERPATTQNPYRVHFERTNEDHGPQVTLYYLSGQWAPSVDLLEGP